MMSQLSDERKSEITLTNISTSDCGVVALQAVTGLSRAEAEAVATEKAEYKHGVGVPRGALNRCLRELGFELEYVAGQSAGFTTATFAMDHEYGTYIVYTDAHVMALIDGNPHNSKGSWHEPVELAYKLTRTSGVPRNQV